MHCKCCLHFGTFNYYLCQGGYGFAGLCLSVSKQYSKAISRLWWNFQYRSCGWCTFLFVFWWHYFKSCWWILMTFLGSFGNATRNSVEVVVIIRKTEMNCLGRGLCSLSAFLCHLIHHNSTFYIWGDTCLCACNWCKIQASIFDGWYLTIYFQSYFIRSTFQVY